MQHTFDQISPRFLRRNEDLENARRQILSFCVDLDLFRYALDPDNPRRADRRLITEVATVEELLGIVTNQWDPDTNPHQHDADPDRELAAKLKHSLLALAEAFDIFIVPAALLSQNEPALWRHFDEEWHNKAGCSSLCGAAEIPIGERRMAEDRIAQNRARLDALRQVWDEVPPYRWRTAVTRFEQSSGMLWSREARHLADHCLQTWMPEAYRTPPDPAIVMIAKEAQSLPIRLGWRPQDAAMLTLALNDVARALLTQKIVSPLVTEALMEPVSHLIDLGDVR